MERKLKMTVTGLHSVAITDEHGASACEKHSYRFDGDLFSWESDYGDIEIDFVPSNHYPFVTPPPYTAKKGKWTRPVRVDPKKEPDLYNYTIKIDGVQYDDPQVIIDSGTMRTNREVGLGSLTLLGDPGGVRDSVKDLLNTVVSELKSAAAAEGGPIFFKDGIDLISVDVEVGPVKVILKIAGPKAPDSYLAAQK